MSGHSKWATIKRKKGAIDAERSKIFQKLADIYLIDIKEIIDKLIDAGIHLGPVSQIIIKA